VAAVTDPDVIDLKPAALILRRNYDAEHAATRPHYAGHDQANIMRSRNST